ncbi:hypothetical protein [Rhodobacter sp. SY28-1]|uniref:hypothetical protein n=1 Tax=Rhodobacter sp. SY28-1 TaxID=2562317 RepID=UPI0010C12820|nr:hypothetical protein [Rhodobacter sp. SY28-1]
MKWLSKIKGTKPNRHEVLAKNLYDALVLDDGPGSDTPEFLTASKIAIRLSDLGKFQEKRLITLEALCFIACLTCTAEAGKKLAELFGQPHPLPIEFAKLLRAKWKERGISLLSDADVGEKCLQEVEPFLEYPFRWGREWLREFYQNFDDTGEHYIVWTEQWLKQFKVMQMVISDNH